MKESKEEFVRKILKMKIQRKRKKELQAIAALNENVARCRRLSGKKHCKKSGQI